MKKVCHSFFAILFLFISGCKSNNSEINSSENEDFNSFHNYENPKTLNIKDLNVKSFITFFTNKYKKNSSLNFICIAGEFPENWVKASDLEYLMTIIYSKQKCCGYMNVFSSYISSEEAEVGGFAILFLNSYITKTKINLGLNCTPKTNIEAIKKIEKWYQNQNS